MNGEPGLYVGFQENPAQDGTDYAKSRLERDGIARQQ